MIVIRLARGQRWSRVSWADDVEGIVRCVGQSLIQAVSTCDNEDIDENER